ncbi:DUF4879 domain-containing protein [Pseudomonas vanderleydeniana]|uniref:YolA family protein n=1 Tax=Pseudomonas vanderleydeniana TaxID=2745495 RepID=A0A9E6TTB1_9PSED|nr:DUF4879 domain-containing protein [Pseudomonas vanderleydeniana]QXI29321.1 YolA family protein [Pseudomonas vanderleydeniana]
MKSVINRQALGRLLCASALSLAVVGPLHAAPAAGLKGVGIYTVASQGVIEDVSDGRRRTQNAHRGPNITVTVVELGYGRAPGATFNGNPISYSRRNALCEFSKPFVPCSGGATVGYSYIYDLGDQQQGTFSFSDRSLAMPVQTFTATIDIN